MAGKELKCVYFIYSQHRLLLKEAVKRLAVSVAGDDAQTLDVVHFHAREDDVEKILVECQTLSFLGGRRLIIVEEPLSLHADGQKRLSAYIENPNPQSVVVFSQRIESAQIKKRLPANALFKFCKASPAAATAEYEIKSGIASWVKGAFAERGKKAPAEVVSYLLRWVGDDLDRLSGEIAKICDAAGDKNEATIDLCRAMVVTTGEAEIFDYIGAVIERDSRKALTLLEPLLERDSVAGSTFAALERQFQLILRTKIEQLRGTELVKTLGVGSGQAYYLEKQSRLFTPANLEKAVSLLVTADFARKSRPTPARVLLEQLTVDLCSLG